MHVGGRSITRMLVVTHLMVVSLRLLIIRRLLFLLLVLLINLHCLKLVACSRSSVLFQVVLIKVVRLFCAFILVEHLFILIALSLGSLLSLASRILGNLLTLGSI